MERHEWPSRGEWAKRERACYSDLFDDVAVSTKADDYGTAEEIAAAIDGLRHEWSRLGRELKIARHAAGSLLRQPETQYQATHRYLDMAEEDRARLDRVVFTQHLRRDVAEFRRALEAGRLMPPHGLALAWRLEAIPTAGPALRILFDRYEAAWERARQQRRDEILATPIDDAAWAKELERRAGLEEYFRRGPFVVPA
jgi:hypothetical protein